MIPFPKDGKAGSWLLGQDEYLRLLVRCCYLPCWMINDVPFLKLNDVWRFGCFISTLVVTAILEAGRLSLDSGGAKVEIMYDESGREPVALR